MKFAMVLLLGAILAGIIFYYARSVENRVPAAAAKIQQRTVQKAVQEEVGALAQSGLLHELDAAGGRAVIDRPLWDGLPDGEKARIARVLALATGAPAPSILLVDSASGHIFARYTIQDGFQAPPIP